MIKHKNQRLLGLDIFRGLAVILMIVYHFFFDLHYFGYLQIDFFTPFWLSFRYLIISFFLFSVGISLVLSHLLKIHLNKVMRRTIVLGISALSVSIASYYLFPDSWIYFGILHFIWLASILVLPLLFHPKTAIVFAVLIFSAYFLGFDDNIWLSILQTMLSLPQQTQDFVPIFPWLSVVLLGLAIARLGWHQPIFSQQICWRQAWLQQSLVYLGKHALLVYLIHQPILFAIFYLITLF